MAWLQINKAVMNLLLQNNGADNTPLLWFDELNKTLFLPLFCTGRQKNLFHYRTNQTKADSRKPGLHSPCLSEFSLSTATTFFQATQCHLAKKANRIMARLFNQDLAGFINDKQTSNQKSRLGSSLPQIHTISCLISFLRLFMRYRRPGERDKQRMTITRRRFEFRVVLHTQIPRMYIT